VLKKIGIPGWEHASILPAILIVAAAHTAGAATLCVDSSRVGCYATIGAAVSHAAAGDTIQVAPGTYSEMVVISKPLTLAGHNWGSTTIDAAGLPNGIFIDGRAVAGLSNVTVTGFTVANAKYEGLLIVDASHVNIQANHITNNDQNLDFENQTCPGLTTLYPFETAEGFDCGEGVHLTGVASSTISGNIIDRNSGGILVSDETGPTHDNTIDGNSVTNNVLDCGITIPSHPRATNNGPPYGVYRNVISNNVSSGNGTRGEGAGIGIFAFLPGARVSDNLITGNRITGNGIPGIAFHAHAPGINMDNNVITGNYIAGNGPDDDPDALTTVPTGINIAGFSIINGTIISGNVIKQEGIDIAAQTAGLIVAQQNNLNGNGYGVQNFGPGSVDARNNWWGCAKGPNASGCSLSGGGNVQTTPWLASPAVPNGAPQN
jgi:parallel beta-helix repeat protein